MFRISALTFGFYFCFVFCHQDVIALLIKEVLLAIKQKQGVSAPSDSEVRSKLITYFNSTKEKFKSIDSGTLSPNRNQKAHRSRRHLVNCLRLGQFRVR